MYPEIYNFVYIKHVLFHFNGRVIFRHQLQGGSQQSRGFYWTIVQYLNIVEWRLNFAE